MSSYRVCSKCNTVYNHQISYCFVDGEELVLSNALQVPQDVPRPVTQEPIENSSNQIANVDHTDVVPKHQQNTFGEELIIQESKKFDLIEDDEDDIFLSLLMEESDTTVTDGSIDNIEFHQQNSISQEISMDLPPLNEELSHNSNIHFDDTTDIFSSSNAQINLEHLDSTQPIMSKENTNSPNISFQNSPLQSVEIEHNIIDGMKQDQFRHEQLRYDDLDDVRQNEIGIDELMGLQHQKKQQFPNTKSSSQWGGFSDESLPTEELPLPKVQDFSLHDGDDLLIEEEDEITNFEKSSLVNDPSSPDILHPNTSSAPNLHIHQTATLSNEDVIPQQQVEKNPRNGSIPQAVYQGISPQNTSPSQEISSPRHLTPPSTTTHLSSYIIGFILFPLGLLIGFLISNKLSSDANIETNGDTIAIATQKKDPSETEEDIHLARSFDVISTTKTQVKVEVSQNNNASEKSRETEMASATSEEGIRTEINEESNPPKDEIEDGNNLDFIDIEIQLDDGILSDGSENLVQIYDESCTDGKLFWEGRDVSHVMQFPIGENKLCISYKNNEWLFDISAKSNGILLISADGAPVFK